jgi:hypothetical protein
MCGSFRGISAGQQREKSVRVLDRVLVYWIKAQAIIAGVRLAVIKIANKYLVWDAGGKGLASVAIFRAVEPLANEARGCSDRRHAH